MNFLGYRPRPFLLAAETLAMAALGMNEFQALMIPRDAATDAKYNKACESMGIAAQRMNEVTTAMMHREAVADARKEDKRNRRLGKLS
jgi:hypothetical protein